MTGKILCIFLIGLSLAAGLTMVNASEEKWYEPGSMSGRTPEFKNIRAGYTTFKEKCKTCHFRGNDQNAPFLCPDSKTMRGWNRVFARENATAEKSGCLNGLSSAELMNLNDYLYTHARDAKNPYDDLECSI